MRMSKSTYRPRLRRTTKYNSRKTAGFDSQAEKDRYQELLLMERAGIIQHLRRQVPFVLIPNQYEPSTEVYKKGPKKGQKKPGKLIYKKCEYIADFVYVQDGKTIVEDKKGFQTPDYIIKKKLMLFLKGIRIYET